MAGNGGKISAAPTVAGIEGLAVAAPAAAAATL